MTHLRYLTLTFLVLTLSGALIWPATSWAQDEEPPNCDEVYDEETDLTGCADDLNDEQDTMLTALDNLVSVVTDPQGATMMAARVLSRDDGKVTNLKDQVGKMKRENDRTLLEIEETTNEEFVQVIEEGSKKGRGKCGYREIAEYTNATDLELEDFMPPGFSAILDASNPKLRNEKCDAFWARDADNRRTKVNERANGLCEQHCTEKIQGKSKVARQRHIKRTSEAIDSTKRTTNDINYASEQIAALNQRVRAFGLQAAVDVTFPECELAPDGPEVIFVLVKSALVGAITGAKLGSRIADGVKESGESFCEQDVAGFNTSSACLALIVVHQLAEGTVDVLEGMLGLVELENDVYEAYNGDGTHSCVVKIRTEQAAMMGLVRGIDTKMTDLSTQMGNIEEGLERKIMENREYIRNARELVLTPHGQRDRVPLYEAPDEQD